MGGAGTAISSVGINFDKWSTEGVISKDGAVFFMDPDKSKPAKHVTVAQITVPTDKSFVISLNLQGRSVQPGDKNFLEVNATEKVPDWQQAGVFFQLNGTDPSPGSNECEEVMQTVCNWDLGNFTTREGCLDCIGAAALQMHEAD